MKLTIELEREDDGRWIADATPDDASLPTTLVYGATREEAAARAEAAVLRVLADRLEAGTVTTVPVEVSVIEAVA